MTYVYSGSDTRRRSGYLSVDYFHEFPRKWSGMLMKCRHVSTPAQED